MRDQAKKNPPSRNQAGPRVLALARMAVALGIATVSVFEHLPRKSNKPQTVVAPLEMRHPEIYHQNTSAVNQIYKNLLFCIKTSVLSMRDRDTDRLITYFYSFFSGHSFWGLIDWFLPRKE